MDFAADAVLDIAAPTPRDGGRPARESDAGAFARHLASHINEAGDDTPASLDPDARCSQAAPKPETAASPAPGTLGLLGLLPATLPQAPAARPLPTPGDILQHLFPSMAPASAQPAAAETARPTSLGAAPAPAATATPPASSAGADATVAVAPATAQPREPQAASESTAQAALPLAAPLPPIQTATAAPTPATPAHAAPTPELSAVASAVAPALAPMSGEIGAKRAPEPTPLSGQGAKTAAPKSAAPEAARAAPTQQPAQSKTQAKPSTPMASPAFAQTLAEATDANTPTASASSQTASPLSASTTHQTQAAALDQSAQRAQPAAAQVSREIVRRFDGGNTSFELRLDPPELGRVEVRLEVSRDHRVTATVSADSPQALSELARHARELEQSLQSAGLELADNGLSFDLRQDHEAGARNDDASPAGNGGRAETTAPGGDETPRARPIGLERWRGVRVDVMA